MARKQTSPQRGARRRHAAVDPQPPKPIAIWFNRLLVSVCGVILVAGTVRAVDYLMDLEVERIAVSGVLNHTSAAEIETQVAQELTVGFLFADLERVRRRLESMPWVHFAQVRRHWPNTIGIHITEQQPIARWGRAGFLNHEGDYFPVDGAVSAYADLPLLEGPEGSAVVLMQRYLRLESVLTPLGIEIQRLSQDSLGQLVVAFESGTTLLLGNHDFVPRLRRFARLWEHELQGLAVARVDMRYEHGAAVSEWDARLAMTENMLQGDR
jgi:cell division protein FtsQ